MTGTTGSVLYDVEIPRSFAGTGGPALAVGQGELRLPVRFAVATCDGHAIRESKKPYAFLLYLSVDGADPIATTLPVGDAERDALQRLQQQRCAKPYT